VSVSTIGRLRLAALSVAALAALAASAPVAGGADRPRFDTRVLALVPTPGYPARAYVHPNGRIYEGTYESDDGQAVPSKVFEYSGAGQLQRSFTIEGQNIGQTHGVQVAQSDSRGRLVLLDTSPARALILDPDSGRQSTYSSFPDLPLCSSGTTGPDCSPATQDERAVPNYAAWGPDGSLYVTDYLQAVIWRVPPGGGEPEVWLASPKLDGIEFGTTGIMLAADHQTLFVGQGSSAGGGDGNPTTGKIYKVEIKPDGSAGELTSFYESGPTELPDGFAFAKSGNLYVPLAGPASQIAVVAPDGTEIERIGTAVSGDNGSAVPFDTPSGGTFLGTRFILANQSAIAGDATHQAILDVETGEPGLKPLIPKGAGTSGADAACVVRKRGGKPHALDVPCRVRFRVDPGRYRFQLKQSDHVVAAGHRRTDGNGRLIIRVKGVDPGRYRLIVSRRANHRSASVRVLLPL
jgi:sugar lactone lactonase YvrE